MAETTFWEDVGIYFGGKAGDSGTDIDIVVTQDQELISIPTTEISIGIPSTTVNVNTDALAEVILFSEFTEQRRFEYEQKTEAQKFKKLYSIAFIALVGFAVKYLWGKI